MTRSTVEKEVRPTASREGALHTIARVRAGERVPGEELDFRGVSLRGADLSDLTLAGADFTDADLSRANLSGTSLFKARMVRTGMVGAKLDGAELSGADLSEANLEDASAVRAGLGMTRCRRARLFSTDLESATLTKADLTEADARCARLRGARIREATLKLADFTEADLREADLSLSDLDQATLNNADLRDSRLRAVANFHTAKWLGADIRNINFAGAYRLRRHVVDENYLWEFRTSGRIRALGYHVWKATSDCGRSLFRWMAWISALMLLFAVLYQMVGMEFGTGPSWLGAMYFSVVTLTTLGYGDIVPVTPAARILASTQVILGYLMLGGLLSILANKMARRGE